MSDGPSNNDQNVDEESKKKSPEILDYEMPSGLQFLKGKRLFRLFVFSTIPCHHIYICHLDSLARLNSAPGRPWRPREPTDVESALHAIGASKPLTPLHRLDDSLNVIGEITTAEVYRIIGEESFLAPGEGDLDRLAVRRVVRNEATLKLWEKEREKITTTEGNWTKLGFGKQ